MPRRTRPVGTIGALLDLVRVDRKLDLDRHDPGETFGWDKELAKAALGVEVSRLAELQKLLFAEGSQSLLVVLRAMDAGRKDGVLREVFTGLNPAGIRVTSFVVPSEEELAHDYLTASGSATSRSPASSVTRSSGSTRSFPHRRRASRASS
jgi:polyphosphate kinase 2 (PPK2 family)